MIIVIPMAGGDDLFQKQGYPFAKPLTEIDGRPMIEHAWSCLEGLEAEKVVFVVRREDDLRFHLRDVLTLLEPKAIVVRADGPTAGAACTTLLAIEHLDCDEELVITNGDQILAFDVRSAIDDFRHRKLDAGTLVFDSIHPRWSFVRIDDDELVVEAAEKRPISRHATAGLYYFRRAREFVEAAQCMIRKDASTNDAFFVCPVFNELILTQHRIGIHEIDRAEYVSLATPQSVEEYEQMLTNSRRNKKS